LKSLEFQTTQPDGYSAIVGPPREGIVLGAIMHKQVNFVWYR